MTMESVFHIIRVANIIAPILLALENVDVICHGWIRKSLPRKAGFLYLAGATGLEPATSGVTGRRSNQLNYAPNYFIQNLLQETLEPKTPNLPEASRDALTN